MSRGSEAYAAALLPHPEPEPEPDPVPQQPQTVTFKDIGIRRALYRALNVTFPNITLPTEMQQQFIPAILDGKDVLLKDGTGSGKSFGMLLALLNKPRPDISWTQEAEPAPSVITSLLIVPHRDLAYQFMHWVEQLTASPGVSTPRYGNSVAQIVVRDKHVDLNERIAKIRDDPPHILIGTPQALLDVYAVDPSALQLSTLSSVVVDEVDYLIETVPLKSRDKTFYKAFSKAKKKIERHPSPTRQLLDIIYASRVRRTEKDVEISRDNLPQLIMTSATLRKHLDLFLFKEGRWLRRDQLVKLKRSEKANVAMNGLHSTLLSSDGSPDDTGIFHSVLIAFANGHVRNIPEAQQIPDQSVSHHDLITPESIFNASPTLEIHVEHNEKYANSPSPFNANALEAVATAFALDVPSVGLLVLPASSPVQRAVYELKQLGVNAEALDLAAADKGRRHLLTGSEPVRETPILLVSTLASTRGLDLPHLTHVFILGIPEGPKVNGQTFDAYLHLAGRVGRFDRGGKVITVVEGIEPTGQVSVDDAGKMMRIFKEIGVSPVRFSHFD